MCRPDRADHDIHFDGDWTETEQRLLERAISDVEKRYTPTNPKPRLGKPWICYCRRLREMTIYMAHRAGWMRVLHAYSALELGLEIICLGQEEAAAPLPA